ncbi:MAG: PilN domain-containing protein [Thermodesulfobacteriota bacterium]
MIRINLLPFRAARKRENIKRQITLFVLSVLLLLVAMAYTFVELDGRLSDAEARETHLKSELAKYEKDIQRINSLKEQIGLIEKKLTVIKQLEQAKQGPVRMLDELAEAVPKEKLWISSLAESNGSLSLRGMARDNETVAEFMVNLENSPYIVTVDLQSTQSTILEGVNLSDFSLQCKIDPSGGSAKKTAD